MKGILAAAHARLPQVMKPGTRMMNNGGTVYANNGADLSMHPGSPMGTDTVPAWLSEGEFVVDRDSAKQFAPQLEAINSWEPNQMGSPDYIMSMLDDMINKAGGV